ncbi:hypothetical protein [Solemya velesiana gill symbiont]|uniref:Uncharacterized protein n=1 Tax=Solemya velesiana gill symbiont TaxID=1918948 RepID=A0A1T2KRW0_9GAMM|nr:hypothetical protein [Solemya velesiana gill symbiont]OOZ35609.1 hypothetical protein BOW51_11260 [Solemya velesiana gill symbiont]
MDSSSIDLPGSEVESIKIEQDTVVLRFSRAIIIKTMTGSVERTRWWQAGELIFEGAEVEGDLPDMPGICDGGDVGENIYTYRDMIPVQLESRGRAHCDLRFRDSDKKLVVQAEAVKLVMEDRPHYIEHIRPE